MREAQSQGQQSAGVARLENTRQSKQRRITRCSVCTCRIWFEPIRVIEPEDAPEARLSWTLCNGCYQTLLRELRRSPIRSPLRLRIAMGMVAAERWPQAYSTQLRNYIYDRRWIVFMTAAFITAMILHLVVILIIAGMQH
ncbi:MAG TPA: hypothetical protein VH593_20230 [Ktedonobacteraceae bacterium]|jgi:hypothetical protein